jgi:cell division protease FtsH
MAIAGAVLVSVVVAVALTRSADAPDGGQVTLDATTLETLEQYAGPQGNVIVVTGQQAATAVDPIRTVVSLIVPLALLAVLAVFVLRMHRASSTNRDSSSGFRTILPSAAEDPTASASVDSGDARPVHLGDVAGCDEAKLELTEVIEFLKAPERFRLLGAHIPRGVMLHGPPGTGKTMLARAVAAEAGVPFHYASGSEFVEKFVGVGARRVRELFAGARQLGRGVIFIDEFDAIGRSRGGPNSHEEREQTLNQLLIELDGFTTSDEIVVIAATNRVDILDQAVLRPGRFNRKIHVGLPDVAGRRAILAVHAVRKPLAPEVDLDALARRTYGFSGAQLSDLLNEAAIIAARGGAMTIAPADIHAGWLKVAVGTSRRRSMDERERSIIAAHEIGHAICGRVHGDKRKVEEISLFAHGDALGVTVSSQEDNDLPSESDLRARLVALMGGRAAEELLFHEVTGGAGDDFDKANRLATIMVTKWGMGRDPEAADGGTSGRGDLGFLVASSSGSMPSGVQAASTRAIRAILDEAYESAYRTLVEHVDTLRRLAAYLVEHERLDGETFNDLFEGRIDVPRASEEWRPTTSRPRAWDEVAVLADRRFPRVEPAPVAIAASQVEPVAAEPTPAVATTAAAETAAAVAPRRRPTLRRRLRHLAAGYLEQAEEWLRAPEAETDRR